MKFTGLIYDNLKISINSIRSNLLRTCLTIIIIAIGIMSLVGILTAIESIKATITNEFTNMGANTFSIRQLNIRHEGKNQIESPQIKYDEARRFKEEFLFPAKVSISVNVSWAATAKNNNKKTDPNISVIGVDENFLITSGHELSYGRNFSQSDISSNENLVLIGNDIAKRIFPEKENPVDESIYIGNKKYRILGVLKEKGTSFSGEGDKICLITLNNARQNFSGAANNYIINVMPDIPTHLDYAMNEAEGLFRNIRNQNIFESNNFSIRKSDSMVKMLLDNIAVITAGATIIALITLLGASIGLMNIMLVSVTERTREIGIRKALGAKSSTVKQQFLFESVFIGQLGGILGIILGIFAGNMISIFTDGSFIIPWLWIIVGVILCFIVSIASGYIPAQKAAKLDPIVALRYE